MSLDKVRDGLADWDHRRTTPPSGPAATTHQPSHQPSGSTAAAATSPNKRRNAAPAPNGAPDLAAQYDLEPPGRMNRGAVQ